MLLNHYYGALLLNLLLCSDQALSKDPGNDYEIRYLLAFGMDIQDRELSIYWGIVTRLV